MRERYPEAMALADHANQAADGARTIWFGFLAFMTFLALAVFGTSHSDLFLATPLALPPPISIEIDLVGFYIVAPFLLLALHVYLLTKLVLLRHVHEDFETQLHTDVKRAFERDQARKHLNTTLFLRTHSAWRSDDFLRMPRFWLMSGLVFITLAVAPVATHVFTWIIFLPYQSEPVTMIHRLYFAVDVVAVVVALRAVAGPVGSTWIRKLLYGMAAAFVVSAWIVLTFPRECWDADEIFCWDNNPVSRLVAAVLGTQRTIKYLRTTALGWPPSSLSLANQDFVDNLKITDLSKVRFTHALQARSLVGADLSSTDLRKITFRWTDLRLANLSQAQMTGADLTRANLQGGQLARTDLRDANLSSAKAQGANFVGADLRDADLSGARLQGASLVGANMRGSTLAQTLMLGANLLSTNLQGATLNRTEMQATHLVQTEFQGALFIYVDFRGAYFFDAQIQGAVFRRTLMTDTILNRPRTWHTGLLETRSRPLVISPQVQPITHVEFKVADWLEFMPDSKRSEFAKQRLQRLIPQNSVLASSDVDLWQALAMGHGDKGYAENRIRKFRDLRREFIVKYACSKLRGAKAMGWRTLSPFLTTPDDNIDHDWPTIQNRVRQCIVEHK